MHEAISELWGHQQSCIALGGLIWDHLHAHVPGTQEPYFSFGLTELSLTGLSSWTCFVTLHLRGGHHVAVGGTLLSVMKPCSGAGGENMAHASTAATLISWIAAVHSCHGSSINAFILLRYVYSDISPAQCFNLLSYFLPNKTEEHTSEVCQIPLDVVKMDTETELRETSSSVSSIRKSLHNELILLESVKKPGVFCFRRKIYIFRCIWRTFLSQFLKT